MKRPQAHVAIDIALLTIMSTAVLAVTVDYVAPLRPFLVLVAASLVPGGAILTRVRTRETITDLALMFGLSFALEIAGSLVLAWTGWWHPWALAVLLGAGSTLLLITDLFRQRPLEPARLGGDSNA